MGVSGHKKHAPKKVTIAVVSASTTRPLADDESGHWMSGQAEKKGHDLVHHTVVSDDEQLISQTVSAVINKYHPDVILLSGGTGIGPKDLTIEAVSPLFDKELTAFGPLFAQLSYREIDSAAILSRAIAGTIDDTVLFCIPGSLKACKLACTALIFPELGHLVKHLQEG